MQKNVIITVYANSGQAPCEKWAKEYFDSPPIILSVPGGGGGEFRSKAIGWARTGDLFKAALKELRPDLKDVEISKRGLVTFSVGWSFADELLKFKNELERLDAYLLLDGCHSNDLTHWIEYGKRAANLQSFMMMAHSKIKPPFVSTSITNKNIFDKSIESDPNPPTAFPDYILTPSFPVDGIKISVGQGAGKSPITRHWDTDPLFETESHGDLYRLCYNGDDAPTHCYIAWYVAERLWRVLGESWNTVIDEEVGTHIIS